MVVDLSSRLRLRSPSDMVVNSQQPDVPRLVIDLLLLQLEHRIASRQRLRLRRRAGQNICQAMSMD